MPDRPSHAQIIGIPRPEQTKRAKKPAAKIDNLPAPIISGNLTASLLSYPIYPSYWVVVVLVG
jgi:hypothetical protein